MSEEAAAAAAKAAPPQAPHPALWSSARSSVQGRLIGNNSDLWNLLLDLLRVRDNRCRTEFGWCKAHATAYQLWSRAVDPWEFQCNSLADAFAGQAACDVQICDDVVQRFMFLQHRSKRIRERNARILNSIQQDEDCSRE